MKSPFIACVVFSDYPIKTMAYQRFLSGLGEKCVYSFRSIDLDFTELSRARLVICDMNIMKEFEEAALSKLERTFHTANILFLEEDHSDMRVKFSNQRDICRLGKLAEINVIHSTLKELLLQTNRKPKKNPRHRDAQIEQT
ncbi:hypothetical protein [Limnobacter sp.]|uniref:hypothetical protein n=1 Tax=Limnobacter sp. TaxID=2003368 RepID=UPI00311ED671